MVGLQVDVLVGGVVSDVLVRDLKVRHITDKRVSFVRVFTPVCRIDF